MSNVIDFTVSEVVLEAATVSRKAAVGVGNPEVSIEFELPRAAYRPKSNIIRISTKYVVSIAAQDKADSEFAKLEITYAVVLDASRLLNEKDASDGLLEPAKDIASLAAHPYHRRLIASLTLEMALPPLAIPLNFGDNFEEEEDLS